MKYLEEKKESSRHRIVWFPLYLLYKLQLCALRKIGACGLVQHYVTQCDVRGLASRMSRLRSLGPFNTKATSCSSYWHLHSSSSTGLSAKTLLAFNPSQYQSHPLKKELQEVTALSSSSYLINYFSFVVINGQSFQTGIYVVPLSCRQRLRKASGGISPARELPMSSPVAQLLPDWLNRTSPSGLGPKLPQVHICGKGM